MLTLQFFTHLIQDMVTTYLMESNNKFIIQRHMSSSTIMSILHATKWVKTHSKASSKATERLIAQYSVTQSNVNIAIISDKWTLGASVP